MIVDTHLHPIADDTTKYPIAPLGGQQSAWSVGVHMTGDEIVEHIKHAGVDKVTLVQASTVHGYDNTYTAECVAKLPDYFVGVCCIDPQVPDAADTLSLLENGARPGDPRKRTGARRRPRHGAQRGFPLPGSAPYPGPHGWAQA